MRTFLSIFLINMFCVLSATTASGAKLNFANLDTLNFTYSRFDPFPGDEVERDGQYFSLKARYRPLEVGNHNKFGFWGLYNTGESSKIQSDTTTDLEVERASIGLSWGYDDNYVDASIDIGYVMQEIASERPDLTKNQEDEMFVIRANFNNQKRRKAGYRWFPEWKVGFKYQYPFESSYSDSRERGDENIYDEKRIDGNFEFHFYDFILGNGLHIAPEFSLGVGRLFGKDANFVQGGFGFNFNVAGRDIGNLKIWHPREDFIDEEYKDRRVYTVILTIKLWNIYQVFN